MKRHFIFMMMIIFSSSAVTAQQNNDTTAAGKSNMLPVRLEPFYRNTIKFNPTPMILWSEIRNITFSYERMINKDMSLAFQLGFLSLPNLIDDTLADLIKITDRKRVGMNVSFDYRYYVLARNKRPAPDGLYIGGYVSYYGSKFDSKFNLLDTISQHGEMKGNLNVANLGFELGYQFIFWKHFSLDMLLFGPSFSYFGGTMNFSGNLDLEQIKEIDQEVVDKIFEKYPALGLLFSEGDLTFTGNKAKFDTFFRYSIQIGYHF